MHRPALGLALIVSLLVWPSAAIAQDPPPCAPEKTASASLTYEEGGVARPLIATHERDVQADVSGDATRVSIAPPPGVHVVRDNGSSMSFIVPIASSVALTVSWRQPADPENFEDTSRCSAQAVFTLPITAANPSRGVPQPVPGAPRVSEDVSFAVAPAVSRPDLSPLDVTIRTTGSARFPRARERLRRWAVPMRDGDQVKYKGRLPNLAYATTAQKCRFWWFICGPVNSHLASLNANNRGQPDLDGSNAILRSLAYSQPLRWASRFGIVVTTHPGAAKNRPFGFDVQVRQSGRLLARVRRAGRCIDTPLNGGIQHRCKVTRHSTLLR